MNFKKLRFIMKNTCSYITLLLFTTTMLFAVEDMYHQNIRSKLQQQYDVIGGRWALYDNEQQTNDKMQLVNVSSIAKTWQGDEPF